MIYCKSDILFPSKHLVQKLRKVDVIMSQPCFMAPLFSFLIVAEMGGDAEYPYAAIMQGIDFNYLGSG